MQGWGVGDDWHNICKFPSRYFINAYIFSNMQQIPFTPIPDRLYTCVQETRTSALRNPWRDLSVSLYDLWGPVAITTRGSIAVDLWAIIQYFFLFCGWLVIQDHFLYQKLPSFTHTSNPYQSSLHMIVYLSSIHILGVYYRFQWRHRNHLWKKAAIIMFKLQFRVKRAHNFTWKSKKKCKKCAKKGGNFICPTFICCIVPDCQGRRQTMFMLRGSTIEV